MAQAVLAFLSKLFNRHANRDMISCHRFGAACTNMQKGH